MMVPLIAPGVATVPDRAGWRIVVGPGPSDPLNESTASYGIAVTRAAGLDRDEDGGESERVNEFAERPHLGEEPRRPYEPVSQV